MTYDIKTLPTILKTAINAAQNSTPTKSWGCARVYIVLTNVPRANSKVYKMFEAYGFKFRSRAYSRRKALYIGYDNATGREWFQAEAMAKVFKENGIECYVDADDD